MSAPDIKPSQGRLHVMSDQWGDTDTIIRNILKADAGAPRESLPPAHSYISDLFALSLQGDTIRDTCRAIYDFVTTHIDYVDDNDKPAVAWLLANQPDASVTDTDLIHWVHDSIPGTKVDPNTTNDWQVVQMPGELWHNRRRDIGGTGLGGDCKSMSVFSAACICAIYGDIYRYRFISQDRDKDYHHVYVVVTDENGHDIVLDCVEDAFDKEVLHAKQKDMTPEYTKVGASNMLTPSLQPLGGSGNIQMSPLPGSTGIAPKGGGTFIDAGTPQGVTPIYQTASPLAGIPSWAWLLGGVAALYLILKD